jgi:hypothetical protein
MKGTWETTDSGGSGALGELAAVVIGAVVVAAVAVPVINAVANLLEVAAVIVGALVVLGSVGLVLLLRVTGRRRQAISATVVSPPGQVPRRAAQAIPAPQRPPIGAPREVHLHFHGVTAEDVAAIVADVNHEDR